MSYSKVFKLEDLESGVLGPIQSNEYWVTAKVERRPFTFPALNAPSPC